MAEWFSVVEEQKLLAGSVPLRDDAAGGLQEQPTYDT
jgi:hypothetical protein